METVIFALCAATSIVAAGLLLRGWLGSRSRLLLWSSAGFLGLAANNIVLFVDEVVAPDVDLSLWRNLTGLIGLVVLLYGLLWETE